MHRTTHKLHLPGLASLALVASLSLAPGVATAAPGVSISDATPAQKKEAQTHYDAGAKLFDLKKFEEALSSFQKSYEVVRSPNAHLMMARSLIELNRDVDAYRELSATEEEAKTNERYAQTLEKVRIIKAEVKKKIAVVRVSAKGAASLAGLTARIGAETVPLGEERVLVPGKLHFAVIEGGVEKVGQDIDIVAGDDRVIELTMPAAPPVLPPVTPPVTPPPRKTESGNPGLGYIISGSIVAGLGVAGLAAGTAYYFMSKSDYSDLEAVCGADGKSCPPGSEQQIQDGRDKQAGAVIAWVAGGATAALGVGLLIAGLTAGPDKPKDEAPVTVSVGPGYIGVKTRF